MSEDGDSSPDTAGADHLLVLAHSRPADALARARAVLSRQPPAAAAEASIAHQAAGISLRDLGQAEAGLGELRRALHAAQASGQAKREADVRASPGVTLALVGNTTRGMAQLDGAVRMVLSGCESGRASPAGADELLGLASSMMPMGTVGIAAAVVPVSDRVTPGIMGSLHEHVAGGAGLPDALRLARMAAAATDDPVTLATACSFLALGV